MVSTICDIERCANPGCVRIFKLDGDETLSHPLLCEGHAFTFTAQYIHASAGTTVPPVDRPTESFRVGCVAIHGASDAAMLFLAGENGSCVFSMMFKPEAWMLGFLLLRRAKKQVSTHAAVVDLIDRVGGSFDDISIDCWSDAGCQATITILQDAHPLAFAVRASDAVAISLTTGSPLRITRDFIESSIRSASSNILQRRSRPMS